MPKSDSASARYVWLLKPYDRMTKKQIVALVERLLPDFDGPAAVLMVKADFDLLVSQTKLRFPKH